MKASTAFAPAADMLIAALGELETYPPDHRETAMHLVRRIDDLARKIRDAVLTGGGGF